MSDLYIERLQKEIEDIETKIKELTQEQAALKRQLVKAKRDTALLDGVTRKNSATRIMVENRILAVLKNSEQSLSSARLFREALFVDFQMNHNTFRTYLHRMKNRGLIKLSGKSGMWVVAPDSKSNVDIFK